MTGRPCPDHDDFGVEAPTLERHGERLAGASAARRLHLGALRLLIPGWG